MASLANQQTAAAIFYAVLGRNPSEYSFKNFGEQLETGQYTLANFVSTLLASAEGITLFQGKSNSDIVTKVYTLVYGSTPSSSTVSDLLTTGSLPNVIASLVDNVLHYEGFDSSLLSSQLAFTNKINSILYSSTASLPALNLQEQIAALYLGIPGREVDSSGLKYWSTDLQRGTSYADVIRKQLLTPEYQQKVGQLSGDADPLPVCDPFIIRNNRPHSGCIFWQPADFSANSEGVIQPRAEWGRLWL